MTDVRTSLCLKDGKKLEKNEESIDESIDPRVQIELERLNSATDLINKLEIELDEARSNFRLLLSESSVRVNYLAKKLGSCVERARPYYEARMRAKQLHTQTQKAALRYERASSAHAAAKEMVYLAEEGLKKEGRCFDPAWQEMLNHGTLRVNEAENERVLSHKEHQKTSFSYNEADKIVQQLHQDLKKSIVKSSLSTRRSLLQLNNLSNQHQLQLLPYFEMKAQFNQMLEEQRKKVHHLEENVLKIKMSYADALHNLEEISDEIHQKRSLKSQLLSERGEGAGAESPCDSWDNENSQEKIISNSASCDNMYLENLSSEETYLSLPSKLKLRPSILATSYTGDKAQDKGSYFNQISVEVKQESEKHYSTAENFTKDTQYLLNIKKLNLTSDTESTSAIVDYSQEAVPYNENVYDDKHFEDIKPTYHDDEIAPSIEKKYFLSAPDLNILRVQREEMSDSESLASTDTIDTLDDNQIECLLLDKMLSLEIPNSEINDSTSVCEQ